MGNKYAVAAIAGLLFLMIGRPCFAQNADFDTAQDSEARAQVCRFAHDWGGKSAAFRDAGIPIGKVLKEVRDGLTDKGPKTNGFMTMIVRLAYQHTEMNQQEVADLILEKCQEWWD